MLNYKLCSRLIRVATAAAMTASADTLPGRLSRCPRPLCNSMRWFTASRAKDAAALCAAWQAKWFSMVPHKVSSDTQFIRTTFRRLEGWCSDDAAYVTCWLMGFQHRAGLSAGVVEIGVYKGKYLSLLYQKALQYGQPVVGIDEFEWSPRQSALDALQNAFGSTQGLTLVAANSRNLSADQIIEMLGNVKASFISVDGDHSAEGVENDLALARSVLAPGGIIAIDDFMNPRAMGVSEGVYRYFFKSGEASIAPFVHTGNKLFVAEREYHAKYIEAISSAATDNPNLPITKEFNHFRQLGPGYVEQHILKSTVIII